MSLIDQYEQQLLEAARRLQQPAAPGTSRRILDAGRQGFALALGAGAALALVALAVLTALAIVSGGQSTQKDATAMEAGWYSSSADVVHGGPKDAPRGASLFLGEHGSYRLTAGVYQLKGRYELRDDSAHFRSGVGFKPLAGLSTNLVPHPDPTGRCRGGVGIYRVRRGSTLGFELVSDSCRTRARTLTTKPWVLGGRPR